MCSIPTTTSVMATFREAVEAMNGPVQGELKADGKLHRFRTEQDKHGQLSGWYVLYLDGVPAGSFGNWKTGQQQNWAALERSQLSPAKRQAMAEQARQHQQEARKKRRATQRAVALKVQTWWSWARAPSPRHAYLQTKQVKPYGLRAHGEALLVPLVDGTRLVNLQRIYPDGKKRFVAGGRIQGCYCPLGSGHGPLYICEGWATGATIHHLTGHAVACAMNCGNLLPVAESLRERHPDRLVIVAGDNDRFTDGNPGKATAKKVADAVGAEWMVPDFPEGLPGTDYNDRYLLELEGRL